jgi:serine/threonine protein kinase
MSQLVLSYSHDKRDFVEQQLIVALRKRGLDVWYDSELYPGDDFRKEISQRIITSPATLVVWSKFACNSRWVPAEAELADTHNKLLQVILEPCDLPLPFGNKNFADLSFWNGDPFSGEFDKIVRAARALIEKVEQRKPGLDPDAAEDLAETREILAREAAVEELNFIARGEISNVYLGRYGTRFAAVKSINGVKFSPSDHDKLSREIGLTSYLQDPTFLRLSKIIFRKNGCLIVTDFCDGETIARKITQGPSFSVEDVVEIVNQLCKAITEAHARGMQYLRIIPSEIFVHTSKTLGRQIARISPINFTYFTEQCRKDREAQWRDESGPFMAPELWRGPSWFEERTGLKLEDERLMHQKANQFALGMVAWTMLEGQVPFSIPERRSVLAKIEAFLDASDKFSARVLEAKWRSKARALARIVSRMVSGDPSKRWQDLKQVTLLVRALAAEHAANQVEDIVKNAYRRVSRNETDFYGSFYESLFRRAPQLRTKFPSDMGRQHIMLHFALGQLLNYNQQQSEPTTLSQFVGRHSQLQLTEQDFKHFGEALIETFDSKLRNDDDRDGIVAALEIVVWPGIYYLMQKCTRAEGKSDNGRDDGE